MSAFAAAQSRVRSVFGEPSAAAAGGVQETFSVQPRHSDAQRQADSRRNRQERKRQEFFTSEEIRVHNERAYPTALSPKEQAELIQRVMTPEVGLGDHMVEQACCVCDILCTNVAKIRKRQIDQLPLVAWRVLLHHIHCDDSWLSPPGDGEVLHTQYDISHILDDDRFQGLFLSPRGVPEGEQRANIDQLLVCLTCHRSLKHSNVIITKLYRTFIFVIKK
uniref:Uncharacterized protein n=1 Tax=Paramoeba aestuarina TaxID=180227 RepID=A0A7S4N971_9EUKA|mmetsp:Transcript_12639/g.19365  ORF Transcript_12639/g.19365 Transcript_12639/m.19365 type:complete len:220 (+) Transcript_12639:396-1055(+)